MTIAARRSWPVLLLAATILVACGDAGEPRSPEPAMEMPEPAATQAEPVEHPSVSQLAPGFAPISFDFANTGWLVTAIDGVPTADLQDDLATIHFTSSRISWDGCNHGEALYIPVAGSFAVGNAVSTQAGCFGSRPDEAFAAILFSRPLIGRNAEGKLMLSAQGRTLTLSEIDSGRADEKVPPLGLAPFAIADAPAERAVLTIRDGRFSLWMDCADAITGTARLVGSRLRVSGLKTASCETHRPTARQDMAAFLRGSPVIARGANGELLMTDGQTVIGARQCHPDAAPCAHALRKPDTPSDDR